MNDITFFHCDTLRSFLNLEYQLGVVDCHRLPLRKVLYSLARKGYLKTVVLQRGVETKESQHEATLYGAGTSVVDRLHFFATAFDSVNDLKVENNQYGGYCDLRLNTRSIVSSKITSAVIIRPRAETYAYLSCAMEYASKLAVANKVIELPPITTFPCAEKDQRAVMCAQAALMGLVEYWNERSPGMFKNTTAIEINRTAGVCDSDVLSVSGGRGLYPAEIYTFFKAEGVNALPLVYNTSIPKNRCRQDIYGFIESGFPVMACIEFNSGAHALLCVGHTYDRNSWSAMADLGYFQEMGSGAGNYLANTTWIRNFIVHDDNFGPFYFMPLNKMEELLLVGFVVLPDASIQMRPTDAADAAFAVLTSSQVQKEIDLVLQKRAILDINYMWLIAFVKHLKVQCGDGLVLRPVVLPGHKVVELHNGHEFRPIVEKIVEGKEDKYFWYIELTWPDIYCHRQECCGCVVIEAASNTTVLLHIPGMCVFWDQNVIQIVVAHIEDSPRRHFREQQPCLNTVVNASVMNGGPAASTKKSGAKKKN